MEQMELFHIHKKNKYDNKYEIGNSIIIPPTFESRMNERYKTFSTAIDLGNGACIQYHDLLVRIFSLLQNTDSLTKTQLEDLRKIISDGYDISYNAALFKRETALEDYRKDKFSGLPSRLHSMYLADHDGVDFWKYVIGKNESYDIYRVCATGNIFKTNQNLLPNELLDYNSAYNASIKYWKPKQRDLNNECNEYLVQGEVKILERVK